MKKMFSLFLYAGLAFGAVSCSSEYDASPELDKDDIKSQLRGEMTAVLQDTLPFDADTKTYFHTNEEGISTLSVSGMEFSEDKDPNYSKSITLTISDYQGPETYIPGLNAMAMYNVVEDGVLLSYLSETNDESYITITQDGDKWEGSFQFVVRRQDGQGEAVRVKQGSFSIPK